MNLISHARTLTSYNRLAQAVGKSRYAVIKWEKAGRLPRSEFTGETRYAQAISDATAGQISVEDLLGWSRKGWERCK